jgi:type IV fimbrial biogenesis protein FimT
VQTKNHGPHEKLTDFSRPTWLDKTILHLGGYFNSTMKNGNFNPTTHMSYYGIVFGRGSSDHGFTLIELMVVVAIAAILMAVAVPSFRDVTERNRVSTQVNTFVGDLQLARSEAIKRGLAVSLCASSDGGSCLDNNAWNRGWIMFVDPATSGNRTNAAVQPLIKIRAGWRTADTFAAITPTPTQAITYNRDGFVASGVVTMVMRTTPARDTSTKCIDISLVGRQTVQMAGVGSCT